MPLSEPVWDASNLPSPHAAPDKARRVRAMFDAIAPTYERINTLFSAGRDAAWRRRAVKLAAVRPEDRVLDVACGTGDFSRAFARAGPVRVVGCDFAWGMLVRAADRSLRTENHGVGGGPWGGCVLRWCGADALHLPFADGAFTLVSCAFGVRNFQDLDAALRQMHRVLAPGGRVVILEFTRPGNRLFRFFYELYAARLMPKAASWIAHDRCGAYRYLPRSVVSFVSAGQMCARLRAAGFVDVAARPQTFGVVTTYLARRGRS